VEKKQRMGKYELPTLGVWFTFRKVTVDDADKKSGSCQLYNQSSRYVFETVSIHIVVAPALIDREKS